MRRIAVLAFLALVVFLICSLYGFAKESSKAPSKESQQPPAKAAPAGPPPPAEFIQPIEFSHRIHAEKSQIPCEFCHIYARRSIVSGVPPMALCYGCHNHRLIPGSDEKQKKLLKELAEIQRNGILLKWKKIHDLPDYVYFSHKRHIQAGLDCTDCHGEIFKYDALSPKTMITNLSMGWCMKCHKEGRPAVGGKIVEPVRQTRGGVVLKKVSTNRTKEVLRGPTDCYACHK